MPGATLGVALVHRESPAERERGLAVLGQVRDMCLQGRFYLFLLRGRRRVHRAGAGQVRRPRRCHTANARSRRRSVPMQDSSGTCVPATGFLVETLLERGADGDVAEAEAAIDRLAAAPADDGLVIREIWLLRMRALLARAHGDDAAYRDYRDRYRAMATYAGLRGTHGVGRGDAMTTVHPEGPALSRNRRVTRVSKLCPGINRLEAEAHSLAQYLQPNCFRATGTVPAARFC